MKLTFCKAFENAYVAYKGMDRIGFITMIDHSTIRDIDVCINAPKRDLICAFMQNIGRNDLFVITDTSLVDYYAQYGFKTYKKQQDGLLLLRYEMC